MMRFNVIAKKSVHEELLANESKPNHTLSITEGKNTKSRQCKPSANNDESNHVNCLDVGRSPLCTRFDTDNKIPA